jgi:Ni/Co efflux regulator RcnB
MSLESYLAQSEQESSVDAHTRARQGKCVTFSDVKREGMSTVRGLNATPDKAYKRKHSDLWARGQRMSPVERQFVKVVGGLRVISSRVRIVKRTPFNPLPLRGLKP